MFFRAIYEGKKTSSMVVFFPPPSVFPDNHSGNSKRAAGAKNFERNHRRNSWKRLQNTHRLLFKNNYRKKSVFYLFIYFYMSNEITFANYSLNEEVKPRAVEGLRWLDTLQTGITA